MSDSFDETFVLVQSALAGEYSLERELGRGGMGVVYLAREVSLDRLVAVKVLPPELGASDERRLRFLREAQTAARLSHPNIVPIFRVGQVGELVYFAMAYVEGETLTQRVRTKGPLSPHEGVRVLREAAWALAYAHARGIVHRDVKPDNILLEQGTGRALLTDFGIAQVEAPTSLTESGLVLGTAHYMSPEQAAGERPDGRSDLYSLGVVAHFLFAGRVPFDDPSIPALLAKHLTQPAPALAAVAPAVPRRLGEAIDRCLAKTPDQRWPTGEALAEALTASSEPPREVPAPIRVWIAKGEQNRGARIFLILYLSAGLVPLAMMQSPWLVALPVGLVATLLGLPVLVRTRRVLREGYTLEDLRSGLRLHWARRREELVYENAPSTPLMRRLLWAGSALGWTVVLAEWLAGGGREVPMILGGMAGTFLGLLGLVDLVRRRTIARAGSWSLRFWNGRWGERFVALARMGLKRVTRVPAAPQPTELALGRATDALYEALPAAVRRDLRELPATVRGLEADAHALRARIEQLDGAIASFASSHGGAPVSRSLAASADEDRAVAEARAGTLAELGATRDAARSRLAATVAALENIRLGLLRLQLGSAPAASVTAALEAAQRVAEEVGRVAAAGDEVETVLRGPAGRPAAV